jgi:hypothetical protein
MNIQQRLQQLQQRANDLAVQESNLREQIEHLESLRRQHEQMNRQKHQILGAIQILQEQADAAMKTDTLADVATIEGAKKAKAAK